MTFDRLISRLDYFVGLNSEKIRDKIEVKEVPLGSIEGICNGIPTMFDCGEGKCRHLGLHCSSHLRREKSHFDSFRFFN